MSLITKSILAPIEEEDGYRISVMNRHTLNDGITPDNRITKKMFDEHIKDIAPSSKLVGDYYKRNLPWQNYEDRYKSELKNSEKSEIVKNLAKKALEENITLLCTEDTPEFCHRRLLAEECKIYEPSLDLKIK